ncbi:carboxypeptidase regulatory-like domain-containing protein [Shewanella yunxiaonensis]|uniref:Carboxypeptidase regulatory-like domain-containing protein n=1 Tax=Shewanella yunxiaonensis TaxID=2829809 RepID=A0ABX7YRL5_9GAMM|nr:TonB-dependent receptor [Shewanella yunxiaonensis]QUN05415.1 carboxypeptidase regulatory-like domain-containing protein [Shewanella yunxiaonensis]
MMIQGFTKSRLALAMALALGASTMAFAADTTSSMRGVITGPDGKPAPNTKITLIHQPSGTVTEVTTNETGTFSASGLRVGGPYEVIVDSDVYQDAVKEDIYLQLGQTYRFNEQLTANQQNVERITVTGNQVAYTSNAGSNSTFGADAINNAPSFNRDLKDIIRQNPLATSLGGDDNPLSVAGQNPRFNSISVDGVGINDDFGLNSNGYPTQRSPISVDAIDQLSIETNPFDAKYNGFTGAHVNAVTKSGTNEFHGGLFYEKTNSSWAGKAKNPYTNKEVKVEGIDSDSYGFNVGGPLIKDKLFFFVNYENYSTPVVADWGPLDSGKANETDMTVATYDAIRAFAEDTYGVDIGDWNASKDEGDKKYLVKLDWNINDIHRASFTYNKVKSNQYNNLTTSKSVLKTSTNWYNVQQDMDSYSLKLFSDWTSDFNTEMSVSYKDVQTGQIPGTYAYGTVIINNTAYVNGKGDGAGIQFGPDEYRHANQLETKTWTVNLDGEYLMGDHKLGFGAQYETLDVYNLFVSASLGVWTFDTVQDFYDGNVYSFKYGNAVTNNAADGAANFTMGTYAGYIQDEWALTDSIDLTYGVRYEQIFAKDTPNYNENFYERYGFSNQENLDGKDIWLPRLGLTWYATDALTVRGGIGRFSGGSPNVWISNSFSKDGVTVSSLTDYSGNTDADFTSVAQSYKDQLSAGDGETDAIDPNFKIPSVWRSSIGYDYKFDIPNLGDNYTWSAEFIYSKNQDDATWIDLNRYDTGETTSDGRIIYDQVDSSHTYDILLTNADKDGNSKVFTTSLSKQWDNGIDLSMSYTHQNITEGNFGTSSQASSNWKYNQIINRNETQLGTGYYEVKHSFKVTLGYTHEFFEGYASKFNAYFERRSGLPYTWTMGGAYYGIASAEQNAYAIGDEKGVYGYMAPYIPTGPDDPNVTYADGLDYETFMQNYVIPAGLQKYAGGYVPKSSDSTPWVTTMDVSFQQEVPGFAKDQKGTFYVTIQNFANLLNKEWGRQEYASYSSKTLINANYTADGTLVYHPYSSFTTDNNFDTAQSVWYLKVGVKYTF